MNKYLILLLLFFGIYTTTSAQEFQFGLKAGINKTSGGQLTGIKSAPQYTDATFNAEGEIGYHGGIWVQVNFGKFFVRPEAVYSALESRFDFPNRPAIYSVDEISVPLLIGYNIFGPLDIYAGAAYKSIQDAVLEGTEPTDNPPQIVVQDTPFSAQVGAKVAFGAFGLDIRYDRTLSSEENQLVDIVNSVYGVNRANFEDARLNQIIVSLTIKLWDSANAGKKRRRGGSCYF